MSERGSFVTEYMYCTYCFDKLKKILVQNDKFLKGIVIPCWFEGEELPIIAGKIGGSYDGEELIRFEYKINPEIAKVLCPGCSVRIAVLAEWKETIFTIRSTNQSTEREQT